MQLSETETIIISNKNYWYCARFLGFIWKCYRGQVFETQCTSLATPFWWILFT